jgi:hypothetical protein
VSDEGEQPDGGTAGSSARHEHERRKAKREQEFRDGHPRTGKLRLRWQAAPGHEQVWAIGAVGEEHVARVFAKHLDEAAAVLHDRRIPGSRANIDHLAVAPSGVWVIDAKRYKNKKVTVTRPLFGQGKLLIGGRDNSKLVEGLAKQVALVRTALAEIAPDAPIHGALCFVDSELPMLGTLRFKGYPMLRAKPLAKQINAAGPLSADEARTLFVALAARFPGA